MATSRGHSSREDDDLVSKLKHFDTFYGKAPPGFLKRKRSRPEDSIPDNPENQDAREFLSKAPTKGLWMPLGKEVKVMKCWRCKAYGHRTGDKECPLFTKGNAVIENFRVTHEDPMHDYILKSRMKKKEDRIKQLQALLDSSTTDTDDESCHHSDRRKIKKRSQGDRDVRHQKGESQNDDDPTIDNRLRPDQREEKMGEKETLDDAVRDEERERKMLEKHARKRIDDRDKRSRDEKTSGNNKKHRHHRTEKHGHKQLKKKSKHKKHKSKKHA